MTSKEAIMKNNYDIVPGDDVHRFHHKAKDSVSGIGRVLAGAFGIAAVFCVRPLLLGLFAATLMVFSAGRIGYAASKKGPLLPVPVSTSPSNGDVNPYGVMFGRVS
jgi:hypothetical protein